MVFKNGLNFLDYVNWLILIVYFTVLHNLKLGAVFGNHDSVYIR
jgi:hypothetical protein